MALVASHWEKNVHVALSGMIWALLIHIFLVSSSFSVTLTEPTFSHPTDWEMGEETLLHLSCELRRNWEGCVSTFSAGGASESITFGTSVFKPVFLPGKLECVQVRLLLST